MKRFGFWCTLSLCVSLFILLAVDTSSAAPDKASGNSEQNGASDPLHFPVLQLPHDSAVALCGEPDSICYTLKAYDVDPGDSIKVYLLAGPIAWTPQWFDNDFSVPICFYADTSGTYRFIWRIHDISGKSVTDTVDFFVTIGVRPIIEDQNFVTEMCWGVNYREVPMIYTYDGVEAPVFTLLEGNGTIDQTGLLQYTVDSAGTYVFKVEIAAGCGTDTAIITDVITINQQPYWTTEDQFVKLCDSAEVCVTLTGVDPEGGDLWFTLLEGEGLVSQVDGVWKLCFAPRDTTHATYQFIICLQDECPVGSWPDARTARTPLCIEDTIYVTVDMHTPPTLICPGEQIFSGCSPEARFCFPITAESADGDPVTLTVLSGNATISGDSVCVTPGGPAEFDVVIEARDECGADTCTTRVRVEVGTAPQVILAEPYSLTLCAPETICFDAFVNDADLDIKNVTVNLGTYNPQTSKICFTPDSAGVYTFVLTAVDSCGLSDEDTTTVTIGLNQLPTLSLGADQVIKECSAGPGGFEVCVPVSYTDDGPVTITSTVGAYDPVNHKICFNVTESGEYMVIAYATDDCNARATDTVMVNISLGHPPTIVARDTSIYLCYPQEICLPVDVSDIDNDLVSVTVDHGTYANGQLCFVPYNGEDYRFIFTATDACGSVVIDTMNVHVRTDQDIVLDCPTDTTIFLCEPDTLCFPFGGFPDDATLKLTGTGVWYDETKGTICFYSDCCLENIITAEVTTQCGYKFTCTFTVHVQTNSKPLVILPNDTTMRACNIGGICLPVGVSDIDNNVVSVTTSLGTYDAYRREVCFTPEEAGVYAITVTATDACGLSDDDVVYVNVTGNTGPAVEVDFPSEPIAQCVTEAVCFPITYFDIDGNIQSITVNGGSYNAADSTVCFTPDTAGVYCITVQVTDSCGAIATASGCVTVEKGGPVDIACTEQVRRFSLCGADSICFPIEITGENVTVTTNCGVYVDGQICFAADSSGLYSFLITAYNECDTATCLQLVQVDITDLPVLTCPPDTTVALCAADTLCFPIGVTGDDVQLSVSAPAYLSGDQVCVPVLEIGRQTIQVIAANACGADTCDFTINAAVNEPPVIAAEDAEADQCILTEICVPFTVTDPNNADFTVTTSLGEIRGLGGPNTKYASTHVAMADDAVAQGPEVCFTPDQFGTFQIVLTAIDSCGARDEDTLYVTVNKLDSVSISLDGDVTPQTLCEGPDSICIPITVTGNPSLSINFGEFRDNSICFYADSTGTYDIVAVAGGPCNVDSLAFSVEVVNTIPVEVVCQSTDTTLTLCTFPTTLRFPLSITGTVDSVAVIPVDAVIGPGNSYIEFTVLRDGVTDVRVIAKNQCSADTCGFKVTVIGNTPPQIVLGNDTSVVACQPVQICVPLTVTDVDGNLTQITSSRGIISEGFVCFLPPGFGTFDIVVRATDACGQTSTDTVLVTITEGPSASITCPDGTIGVTMALPDSARVPLVITPPTVPVTVLPAGRYDAATGELVVYIETEGLHTFTVIAAGECGADTCDVTLEINRYNPPLVQCIGSVDTALCLTSPQTLCLPVTITGTNITVSVSPIGTYADGAVCFTVDSIGTYNIRIIAANETEADTCFSTAVVTDGNPPLVNLGDDFSLDLCAAQLVCVPMIITPGDFAVASVISNIGYVSIDSGKACFMVDSAGTYRLIVSVADNCGNSSADTVYVTVDLNEPPVLTLPDDFTKRLCGDSDMVCVDVSVLDDNLMNVISSQGTYDPLLRRLCITPTNSGVYTAIVTAIDSCGAEDQDTINITIINNTPPQIVDLRDTTLYLCAPQPVCIPVNVVDPDLNPVTITVSRGTYADGQVCFVPYDSGTYQIVVTAVDSCGLSDVDTLNVRIRTDQGVQLICPRDTSIFVCQPETLCFPVGGVPQDAQVTLTGTNVWWNAENQTVCFYSDCCLENIIGVRVTTKCGTYECEFTVHVQTNSKPLVIAPKDTTVLECVLSPVCLPVGISDIDKNVTNVSVVGGTWDAYRSQVCLTPTGEGTYTVIVTATDACGLFASDTVRVTIRLNEAPIISFTSTDTVFTQCAPQEICVPISISDPDGNALDIETFDQSIYDSEKGLLCFTPTGPGRYCLPVKVTDACGATDSMSICITVNTGNFADITCPTGLKTDTLCEPGGVCIPITINGQGYSVSTNFGTFAAGKLCFNADSSGTYVIRVIATAECNADTCFVSKQVKILDPVTIACPGNQNVFLCAADTLCYPFTISSSVTLVSVSGGAYLNGNEVCVPVLTAGMKTITLIASGTCATDTCMFTVNATFNTPPVVKFGNDTTITACELSQVCLPFTKSDLNNNIAQITTNLGTVVGNTVCFTPTGYGSFQIIITALDSCGASAKDTVNVTYNQGASAHIACPDGVQFASVCGPTTVCIVAPITPANAVITITPAGSTYNPQTGEVCIPVTSGGTKQVRVIASAQCGADTCDFTLQVTMNQPPVVTCPGVIDTLLCLAQPTNFCFPVTVTGSGVNVQVQPIGTYSAGVVCFPVSAAGTYDLKIIASGVCGVDTCDTRVIVRANQKPTLTLPTEGLTFERCPDDVDEICIGGIMGADAESDVTITKVCGPGSYTAVTSDSGALCFTPNDIGTFNFCFEITDGCQTVTDTLTVIVNTKPDCDVCARFSIDGGECSPVGLRKRAAIMIETNDAIGGFDLLLSYDASALAYQSATIEGGDIQGWEYFTWSLNSGNCGGSCPSGLLRLVGIADKNNGTAHPPDSTLTPNGVLVYLDFQIFNDQTLGDQFVPLRWVWYDCGDNTLSNPSGSILYVDQRIYTYEGTLLWDETDNVTFPESARPFGLGSPDECITGDGKSAPLRCIEFRHGGICIIHPDSIDDRGDINLNGLAYEIADAVLFTSYFIKGLSVFTVSIPGQIAATDVTNDGLTLTVADLAYLIRVIIGDAQPIPKLNPYGEPAIVSTSVSDGKLLVSTETVSDIGVAWLTFQLGPNTDIGLPATGPDAEGMDLIYNNESGQLKMLVYNIGTNRIGSGKNTIIEIPLLSGDEVTVTNVDLCDYDGRPYPTNAKTTLPTDYSLAQNYPNPFNPATTISFRLPESSDWTLTVFNVNGSLVRTYNGTAAAGDVDVIWDGRTDTGQETASGVYFYRLEAGSFSQTRKMVLLK